MNTHRKSISIRAGYRALLMVVLYTALSGCAEKLTPEAYIERGKDYHVKGELESAVIEFKNALQVDREQTEARWQLARVYLDMGNGAAAEKELNRAAELSVSPDAILIPLTEALIFQNKFDQITEKKPNIQNLGETEQSGYYALLGDAYLFSGNIDEAGKAYETALSLAADTPGASLGKARIAGMNGKLDEMRELLDELLERNPEFALAWSQQGDLEHIEGHHEEAEIAFGKAISLRYNNSYDHYRRALVRIGMHDYAAVREDIDALKKHSPGTPQVAYLQGLLHFKNKQFDAAQVEFEKVLNTDRDFINAVFYLGASHFYQGHTGQAEQYLRRYWEKFPGSTAATKLLAMTYYQTGDHEKAQTVIMPMLQHLPDDPFLLGLMGNIYMKQGNIQEGITSLQKLAEQRPETTQLHAQIGLGLMAEGRHIQGIQELEHAVELAPQSQATDLALVVVYLRMQQFDKALETAGKLNEKNPDNPDLLNLLGVTQLSGKDETAAHATFEKILEISPGNPSAAHNLAHLEFKAGNTEKARGYYRQVLNQHPGHLRSMLKMAELEASMGDREKSRAWLEQALEDNPDALGPRLLLSREHLEANQPDKAMALLPPGIVDARRDQPALLRLIADIQMARGETKAAIRTLEDLAKLLPKSAEAQYLLAKAYSADDKQAKSHAAIKRALELDPRHFKSRIVLSRRLAANRQFEQAHRVVDQLGQDYPDHPEVLAQRAWIFAQEGQTKAAADAYSQAYELIPSRELAIELANARLHDRDPEGSVSVLETWLKDQPEDALARATLAKIYLILGRKEEAISAYTTVSQQDPQNVMVLNNLAWLLREKDSKAAQGYAERALEINPDATAAMDTLGIILLKNGQTDKAISLLRKAAEKNPENLNTRYHLSMGLVQNGNETDARKILQKILSQDKAFHERKEAEALLDSLGG